MNFILDNIWNLWPNTQEMAKDTGILPQNLRMIKCRKSIPVHYWMRLVKAVEAKSPGFLTYETLVEYHTPQRLRYPPTLGSLAGGTTVPVEDRSCYSN
jgi:hypothetical protein